MLRPVQAEVLKPVGYGSMSFAKADLVPDLNVSAHRLRDLPASRLPTSVSVADSFKLNQMHTVGPHLESQGFRIRRLYLPHIRLRQP